LAAMWPPIAPAPMMVIFIAGSALAAKLSPSTSP
jgi:hypothetical protein